VCQTLRIHQPSATQLWRTRPMVMHKVAEALHLHYLHWRLQHCAIPAAELNSSAAVKSALRSMPPLRSLSVATGDARGGVLGRGQAMLRLQQWRTEHSNGTAVGESILSAASTRIAHLAHSTHQAG
jgi:hypothetical protein